jgi:enamine deaminase RidA (YjgF/YER057c/UK114 family)
MIEFIGAPGGATYSLAGVTSGAGRYVYVAGQVGFGADGKLVEGGITEQASATFDQIEDVMRQAGGGLGDIVRMGVYLTSLDDYAAFGVVRQQRFPNGLPASTAVQVAGLLMNACIEIDAVGFIPGERAS